MGSQARPSEPGLARVSASSGSSDGASSQDLQEHAAASQDSIPRPDISCESVDKKSFSLSGADPLVDMSGGSRKRNLRREEGAVNEAVPIMQQGGAKDYQSISPSIAARMDSAGDSRPREDANGTAQERPTSAEREAAEVLRREGGTLRKWLEKYGSVELENKGSVARDHLALERTFLAWLRTSLSFASIGIAVTQLFRLNTTISTPSPGPPSANPPSDNSPQAHLRHVGKPLGATFIAISIVILFIGFHRYFEAQHYVIRGKFPASRGSIIVVSCVAGALVLSSLVVILAVAPGAIEN